uniref:TNF receptor superfamily member 11b OPGv.2 variant n=1 Tax=Felis catus TaxID=9685 RepID=A0A223G1M6_FELCA|nr:TNF receptor superfamily member 11b OPGv.2 variant [Felis catus]
MNRLLYCALVEPRSEIQFARDVQMGSSRMRRHLKHPVENTQTAVHLVSF